MPALTTLIQHSARSPSLSNQQEKESKGVRNGKEKMKLFADDMILCVGAPKDSEKELLDLINEFTKDAR